MPAQPLMDTAAFVDDRVAVVDKQLQFPGRAPRRAAGASGPVRVEQHGRQRARRSGRTCRGLDPRVVPGPSASAAPAQAPGPPRAAAALASASAFGNPRAPTATPPPGLPPTRAVRRRQPESSPRQACGRPRPLRPRSPTACGRPLRSRSSPSPSNSRWGRPASGQTSIEAKATLLSGHTRRSRDGGGDTTLGSQQATFGNGVSRRWPESAAHAGRHDRE
jgi:hypothetical protein